ncbi:hypothetical protein MTO96_026582 [Rhipicephalus appendiculatus]
METLRRCGDDYIPYGNRLSYVEEAGKLFTEKCDSYGATEDCVHRVLAPCKGVGADEYTTTLLKNVFGRTLELVCDEYAGNSDACKTLPHLPKLGPNDPKPDNYVELLILAASTTGHRN